mgnify:CR=1 FL=1
MNSIFIDKREIGEDCSPFIIAEMSGNHNQSLERALEIVEAAAESGAHALKLQTYTADTITLDITDGEFLIEDKKNIWTFLICADLKIPPFVNTVRYCDKVLF